jgi:integrase/recombinase XerC
MTQQLNELTSDPSVLIIDRHSLDLKQLQVLFLKNIAAKGRSNNTIKNYRTDLECFNTYLESQQKSLDITQFGQGETNEYGKFLQVKYTSDNSRRRRVQALRLFFDYLLEQGLLTSNPIKKIPISPKFLDIPRPAQLVDIKTIWLQVLEQSQKTKGLERLTALRNATIISLIYTAALKVSDLANLKTANLFLDDKPRVLITPERRDPYTIPIPLFVGHFISSYIAELEIFKQRQGIEFEEIFFNANPYQIISGGLSARGLELIFQEWCRQLKLSVRPKSLRQSAIFRWIHAHHPEVVIKEWLGVAPSYSLKAYIEIAYEHAYDDHFLQISFESMRPLH